MTKANVIYEQVTFAQFCGAGRSLAMLPSFLEEAERLCAKLNGRPSPARNRGDTSPGKVSLLELLSGALATTHFFTRFPLLRFRPCSK